MRYINNKHLQRLADLTELDNANKHIATLYNNDDRKEYIDDNGTKWTSIKTELWALGCCKCWYSEASLQRDQGEVEHFRPKKKVATVAHSGYWWRAFDWKNFRIAHPTVNKRITNYLTGKKSGKGTYFPLRNETNRASVEADELNEEPALLDPANKDDIGLICFDSSNGKPIPRYKPSEEAWRYKRAKDSIDYYHLDEGTWNYSRKDLMDDVSVLCDKLLIEAAKEPMDVGTYHQLTSELLEYLEPFSEFTTAVLQVVREKGLLTHIYAI